MYVILSYVEFDAFVIVFLNYFDYLLDAFIIIIQI